MALVGLNGLLAALWVPGMTAFVVEGGSMEPAFSKGAAILVAPADAYEVGQVVTFQTTSGAVTHRIVEATPEGYWTRGDANATADPNIVRPEQIDGRLRLALPFAGYALVWLRQPLGGLAVLLVLVELSLLLPVLASGSRRPSHTNRKEASWSPRIASA